MHDVSARYVKAMGVTQVLEHIYKVIRILQLALPNSARAISDFKLPFSSAIEPKVSNAPASLNSSSEKWD
jgi:hypothetical protein